MNHHSRAGSTITPAGQEADAGAAHIKTLRGSHPGRATALGSASQGSGGAVVAATQSTVIFSALLELIAPAGTAMVNFLTESQNFPGLVLNE